MNALDPLALFLPPVERWFRAALGKKWRPFIFPLFCEDAPDDASPAPVSNARRFAPQSVGPYLRPLVMEQRKVWVHEAIDNGSRLSSLGSNLVRDVSRDKRKNEPTPILKIHLRFF